MFTRCLCWWSWRDFKGLAVNELGNRRGNPPNYQGQSQFNWLSPKITRATILNNGKAIKNSQSAKPMLLTFPRLKARWLFWEFSRAFNMDVKWVCHCREQVQTTCLIRKIIGWRALPLSGIFCLLFAAVGKKLVERKGFRLKKDWDIVPDRA